VRAEPVLARHRATGWFLISLSVFASFFRHVLMFSFQYTRSHRAAMRRLSTSVFGLACVGCGGLTNAIPVTNRYGAVSIIGRNAPGNRAAANATVILFEAFTTALPSSELQQTDNCVFASVDTVVSVARGVQKAGPLVNLAVGSTTYPMAYDDRNFRYATDAAVPFSYAAGDSAQVTIPGDPAVFPATSIKVRLAEPIIPGTVSVPTGTTPMVFTWNAGRDSSSAIILSLRYANPASASFANEQIYCSLKDDGTHQLPTSALTAFLASPNDKRRLQITRWRTRELSVDGRTFLHIASSIDTTLVFQP